MKKGISETAFASQVEDLLKLYSWRFCHFRPALTGAGWRTAMTGDKGVPDYIAVRPPRLIFAELKDEVKPTTLEQDGWLEDLRSCQLAITNQPLEIKGQKTVLPFGLNAIPAVMINPEVYLWRPSQFEEIMEILK